MGWLKDKLQQPFNWVGEKTGLSGKDVLLGVAGAGLAVATGGASLAITAGAAAGVGASKLGDISSAQREGAAATRRAQEQARQQYAAESRKAEIQNIRSVRQQIRQARISQSSMLNVGAQTGGMGGSGLSGGMSSIGSQLGSNLGYMSQIAAANTAIGGFALGYNTEMSNASMAASRQQLAGTQLGLATSIFGGVGGYDKVAKAFS
jgi:hypothetical protein